MLGKNLFATTTFVIFIFSIAIILNGCTSANSLVSNNPVSSSDLTSSTDTSSWTGIGSGVSNSSNSSNSSSYQNPGSGLASSQSQLLTGNQAPVISLTASQKVVGFDGLITLTAEAIDPNGDPLYYSWIASEGVFTSQTSNKATWKAPSKNVDTEISCKVDDRKGGTNTGKISISVVGGRKYRATLSISRASLLSTSGGDGLTDEWAALPQAKVIITALNKTLISDQNGTIEADIDSGSKLASSSDITVQYLDWAITYNASFLPTSQYTTDQIQFYPGFDGVTVAVAKGDSFQNKRGGIEVNAYENDAGQQQAVSEFQVQAGTAKQSGNGGLAFLSTSPGNGNIPLTVEKQGYSSINGITIPVSLDAETLVNTTIQPLNKVPITDAFVSWTKPFRGQSAVPTNGPFQIGFGQPMEEGTILDDFQMTIQNTTGGKTAVLNGAEVKNQFTVSWENSITMTLTPKQPLNQLTRYSILVNRWNARALDGRLLKNYSGMFGTFTTDSDSIPSITSTSPKNGDYGVSRAGPFEIRFDRPMDPTSLKTNLQIQISDMDKGNQITVNGSTLDNEFSATWNSSLTILYLVPKRTLGKNKAYLVRLITCGLKSSTGKQLQGFDQIWGQFSTGEL
ncbi:MAG: Ig-like domain-containing protein [Candidatus Riflebacteria bacterium]|nr:Ig-like domain-containing protein [Candidatus Riflebacteria bacterium]